MAGRLPENGHESCYARLKSPSSRTHRETDKPEGERSMPDLPNRQRGKLGWLFLWLIGVPVPILIILFLVRGCT
jgi:hypothetical protein